MYIGQAKSENHQLNNENEELDSLTKQIFEKYYGFIKTKQSPPRSLRDNLLCMLHYKHNFDLSKLSNLFGLQKRYVKSLIKQHLYSTDSIIQNFENNLENKKRQTNIDRMIMGKIESKKGVITIPKL